MYAAVRAQPAGRMDEQGKPPHSRPSFPEPRVPRNLDVLTGHGCRARSPDPDPRRGECLAQRRIPTSPFCAAFPLRAALRHPAVQRAGAAVAAGPENHGHCSPVCR